MVAFVAPWCGHCKTLGPEFSAAAASLSPLIPFYAVDCDDAGNKRLCADYQVQGFPTIKAFPRALKGAARDYQGERKTGALIDYAKTLVPDRVKKLRVDDGAKAALTKFLKEVGALRNIADWQKPDLPHALLIHPSTPSIPFLWKVLGQRLSSKVCISTSLSDVRSTSGTSRIQRRTIY
jgi:protein disulfide-isomerase A6